MILRLKRFKDPVHGYIAVPLDICDAFIDNEIFQRLRQVEQTSMRSLYPGARHDRFIHSLGVYHLGCKAVDRIEAVKRERDEPINDDWKRFRKSFEIACLMHDCGHAPFSHACEHYYNHTDKAENSRRADEWLLAKCKKDKRFIADFNALAKKPAPHESFSAALMLEFFDNKIRELGADPILAVRIITGCRYHDSQDSDHKLVNCLILLLHGDAIDVDKLDYLLRDTWASGVKNTAIDIDRLLHGMRIGVKDGHPCLCFDKSSLSVVQSVVDARNYLYDWVFTHHTVKYYTHLLDLAIRRLAEKATKSKPDVFWTKVFSIDSFRKPVAINKTTRIYLPTDGDMFSLLKTCGKSDPNVNELLSHKPSRIALWKTRADFRELELDDKKNTEQLRLEIPAKLASYCKEQNWGQYKKDRFLIIDATSEHLQISPSDIYIAMDSDNKILSYSTVMGTPTHSPQKNPAFFVYAPIELKAHRKELVERIRRCFQ